MEDFVQNLIAQGPWGIVSGAIVYLIVFLQRNNTKKERDADSEQIKTRIALLENEIQEIKNLDLASKLAQIQTDLSWIKDKLNK
jgi:hypothetical protein